MSIGKKIRFEVFKRDKFTCQYCGRKAPDVVLQLDHIVPRAEGGDDDILNLVTSCVDCNLGKGPRELSDDAAIRKQRSQLEMLQERREQLDMMVRWQRSLIDAEADLVRELADLWDELVPGYSLTESGYRKLGTWVSRHEFGELIASMRICVNQYLKFPADQELPTKESVEKAFEFVPKVCISRQRMREKPYLRDLYYIRGILRNRLNYVREWEALALMERAVSAGIDVEAIRGLALQCTTWYGFEEGMEALIGKAKVD